MNIVLCGMMGCGKTTVAAALSRKYSLPEVDTDRLIVERYGDINAIFNNYGEAHFRELEAEIVKEVAEFNSNSVISLGGGCVLRDENVKNLKESGKIYYLRTRAETIIKRLKGDGSRPLLAGGLEEKVNTILSARSHIYESVADEIVDTDGKTPEELAEIIRGLSI